jgi:8-oxo-dGTP diphosphatase
MNYSTAALIYRGDTLLLVKRKPGGALSELWELPGGKVEEGERPEDALVRELQEELKIDATVEAEVGRSRFRHRGSEFELIAYRVTAPSADIELVEHTKMVWMSRAEALKLALAPSDRALLEKLTDL